MKKLNIIITSAFCASVMAVNASAASNNDCSNIFDRVDRINAVLCNQNTSICDPQTILQNIFSGCFGDITPSLPQTPETPDYDVPVLPEIPEQEGNQNNGSNGSISGSVSEYERRVVELVNAERAAMGLSALKINTELCDVAREKSRDMQQNGYFSHNSPTYGSPYDMLRSFGISYNTAGENIAMGYQSPERVVEGWMNSAGHRANILNASYIEIGVGHISNGNYWTQLFIG